MADFGPLSDHLGYLLRRVDVRLMGWIGDALRELGLTPARASAVIYVALHAGCDQMALGRALGVNRASTMKAVNELVGLGFVERRAGKDRRSNALYLTPRGDEARWRIEEITGEADVLHFSGLSDAERGALRTILGKLLVFEPPRHGDRAEPENSSIGKGKKT